MEKRYLNPIEVSGYIISVSEVKSRLTLLNTMLLAIMGGVFLSFGGFGFIVIQQTLGDIDIGLMKFLGASIFPVGLMLIVITGSELFTGDTLMTMGVLDKKITLLQMFKTWILVYIGNLIGSVLLAFMINKAGLLSDAAKDLVLSLANMKINLDFTTAVIRGILANILVVLAVWVAYAAQDIVSKIWGIWFPIMLFVLSGFEHSVANMFFLPLAKFAGFQSTWISIFMQNIIPVTVGNIIGGGIIIPFVYYLAHIKKPLS